VYDPVSLNRIALVLAIGAALAATGAVVQVARTRALAAEVEARGAEIATGAVFRHVDEVMVRMLAERSAATGDQAIRAMLARNGITFEANARALPRSATAASMGPPSR